MSQDTLIMLNSFGKNLAKRLLLVLALFLAFSCKNNTPVIDPAVETQKKQLVGKWVYQQIQANEEVTSGEVMANPTMEFLDGGIYKFKMDSVEEGAWRMEKKDVVIIKVNDAQNERHFSIKELTPQKLVLYNEDEAKVTITLVPVAK